jgi:hypothetical protein
MCAALEDCCPVAATDLIAVLHAAVLPCGIGARQPRGAGGAAAAHAGGDGEAGRCPGEQAAAR